MNMMHNNPGMMQMMMGNMMDVVSGNSTMSRNMVKLMYSHPQMMQYMNRGNVAGTDGKMKMMNSENQSAKKGHKNQH